MNEAQVVNLSCSAKIVRLVLDNQGPLAPTEIADEAYISTSRAENGVEELTEAGLAKPVRKITDDREQVFDLTDTADPSE